MYASGEAIACMNQVRQLQVSHAAGAGEAVHACMNQVKQLQVSHADGAGEASACMYESGEVIASMNGPL